MTDATYTQQVAESMQSIFGVSARAAESAARGRGPESSQGLVDMFRSMGLSEQAAATAAHGRDTGSSAWPAAIAESDPFTRAQAILDRTSDAELDEWRRQELAEARLKKTRQPVKPKKSVAPAAKSSGSRATVIQEKRRRPVYGSALADAFGQVGRCEGRVTRRLGG